MCKCLPFCTLFQLLTTFLRLQYEYRILYIELNLANFYFHVFVYLINSLRHFNGISLKIKWPSSGDKTNAYIYIFFIYYWPSGSSTQIISFICAKVSSENNLICSTLKLGYIFSAAFLAYNPDRIIRMDRKKYRRDMHQSLKIPKFEEIL